MDIKACDRCGRVYVWNENNRFIENGITGVKVIHRLPSQSFSETTDYDLCDDCCELLFNFLEMETEYAINGRNSDFIRGQYDT